MRDDDPKPPPPRPRVGQELGRYHLEALLGEGGMASVYRARHKLLGRTVAIKALHPESAHDTEVVARFLREARAVATLRHPHILSIADAQEGTPEHPPYLVLEYLDGRLLSTRIVEEGALPVAEALRVTAQIADALVLVHEAGIVHRDLKPENVMLVRDSHGEEHAKLLDFGLAKFLLPVDDLRTAEGLQVGTPEYLAPEQVRGGVVGPCTDVYALGALLYMQLTAGPPHSASWLGELFRKILKSEAEPPSMRRDAAKDPVPPALDALVLQCLAKLPEDRYDSMAALLAALREAATGASPAPPTHDGPPGDAPGPDPQESVPARGRWRRLLDRLGGRDR